MNVEEKIAAINEMIKKQEFSSQELDYIDNSLQSIMEHETFISLEAVKCIVMGWWIRDSLKRQGINPDNINFNNINNNNEPV